MRPFVLALLAASLAAPADAQVADRLDDLRLETAVRLALVTDVRTRALDVAADARNGYVTLTGDVPPALRPLAVEVARGVRGVRQLSGLGADDGPAVVPVAVGPPPPRPPRAPTAADRTVHVVEGGDTVFSLARRYGTTVQAILDLNGLDAPDIRVGQRLRVR